MGVGGAEDAPRSVVRLFATQIAVCRPTNQLAAMEEDVVQSVETGDERLTQQGDEVNVLHASCEC